MARSTEDPPLANDLNKAAGSKRYSHATRRSISSTQRGRSFLSRSKDDTQTAIPADGSPLTISILGALLSFFVILTANGPVKPENVTTIARSVREALPAFGSKTLSSPKPNHEPLTIHHLIADLPGARVVVDTYQRPIVMIPAALLFQPERAELQANTVSIFQRLRRTLLSPHHLAAEQRVHRNQTAGELLFAVGKDASRTPEELEKVVDLTMLRAQVLEQVLISQDFRPIPWRVTLDSFYDSPETFVLFRPEQSTNTLRVQQ